MCHCLCLQGTLSIVFGQGWRGSLSGVSATCWCVSMQRHVPRGTWNSSLALAHETFQHAIPETRLMEASCISYSKHMIWWYDSGIFRRDKATSSYLLWDGRVGVFLSELAPTIYIPCEFTARDFTMALRITAEHLEDLHQSSSGLDRTAHHSYLPSAPQNTLETHRLVEVNWMTI